MDYKVLFDVMLLNTDEEGFRKVDIGSMIIISDDEVEPTAVFSSNSIPRECKGSQRFKAILDELETAVIRSVLIIHPDGETQQ